MNVTSISVDAFLSDMFCRHWEELPKSILRHIAKVINYDTVPDGVIADNEEIMEIVKWDRLDKMKLIRVLIRCIDRGIVNLDKIKKNLGGYEYKIKDLTFLFMRKPEFIEFFPINLSEIDTVDAATLLSFGSDYFLDKIDFSKYTFNQRESMNIIKGYDYDREIIRKVNYKSLVGYDISEILIKTGELNIDLFNTSSLTSLDWINLLEARPEMLKYCNYQKFNVGDIFYSIKLCCMFEEPDLSQIVIDRDMSTISPLGWELLLIKKPEIFLAYCNFSKLDNINWNNIIKAHPELIVHKPS
jgi:hypothetical protein